MKLPHIHLLVLTELKKNVYKLKLEIQIEMNIYSEEDIFL